MALSLTDPTLKAPSRQHRPEGTNRFNGDYSNADYSKGDNSNGVNFDNDRFDANRNHCRNSDSSKHNSSKPNSFKPNSLNTKIKHQEANSYNQQLQAPMATSSSATRRQLQ
jgi:hypothetical protein